MEKTVLYNGETVSSNVDLSTKFLSFCYEDIIVNAQAQCESELKAAGITLNDLAQDEEKMIKIGVMFSEGIMSNWNFIMETAIAYYLKGE